MSPRHPWLPALRAIKTCLRMPVLLLCLFLHFPNLLFESQPLETRQQFRGTGLLHPKKEMWRNTERQKLHEGNVIDTSSRKSQRKNSTILSSFPWLLFRDWCNIPVTGTGRASSRGASRTAATPHASPRYGGEKRVRHTEQRADKGTPKNSDSW